MIAEKRQVDYKKIIISVVVIAVIILGFVFLDNKQVSDPNEAASSVKGLNVGELKKELENSKNTQKISDYLFYGDSLYIFEHPYNYSKDNIANGEISLKGINNNKKYNFIIESGLDRGILLNTLEEGCYKIFVSNNLDENQAIYKESLKKDIYVNNGESSKKITILTGDKLLKGSDNKALFINVKNAKPKNKQYDIILDPAGNVTDYSSKDGVYKGSEGNGLVEANVAYDYCVTLKQMLEKEGFSVYITRDSKNIKDNYGKEGRIYPAYKYQAKYYLHIGIDEAEDGSYQGISVVHSHYASNVLSNKLVYNLQNKAGMKVNEILTDPNNLGIRTASLYEGEDGKRLYDDDLWIRETGGKATLAGKYSQSATDMNGEFSINNVYGAYGLNISLGYVTNSEDAKKIKEKKDIICKQIANTLTEYIKEDD